MLFIAYVAVWWLAFRVIFGQRLGFFHWVPVALAAFIVPMQLASLAAIAEIRARRLEGPKDSPLAWLGWAWFAIAIVIDTIWVTFRLTRWAKKRRQVE